MKRNAGILLFKYAFHCLSVGGLIYHILGQIICRWPEAILTIQLNDTIGWSCQSCQRQRALLLLARMMDSQCMDFILLFKYAPIISSWHIKTFGSKHVLLSCLTYIPPSAFTLLNLSTMGVQMAIFNAIEFPLVRPSEVNPFSYFIY